MYASYYYIVKHFIIFNLQNKKRNKNFFKYILDNKGFNVQVRYNRPSY